MVDQTPSADPAAGSVCPWCSAPLTPGATICASCGANLTSDEDHDLPGVTAVDQDVVRGLKKPATASRSRLLSWISGEYEVTGPSAVEAGALAPPDIDVQREILRLELEAEVANLQAEVGARYAEAVVEGRVSDLPDGLEAVATGSSLDDVRDALETPAEDQTTSASAADADAGAEGETPDHDAPVPADATAAEAPPAEAPPAVEDAPSA